MRRLQRKRTRLLAVSAPTPPEGGQVMNAPERARASSGGAPSLLSDRLLLAIVDSFVRILARCGSTAQEIIGAVLQAVRADSARLG